MFIQTLVEQKITAGQAIQDELRKDGFPISGAFWIRMPESGYWRLVIGSAYVEEIGPIEAYRRLQSVLARLRLPQSLRSELSGSISLLSPRDPAYEGLRQDAKGPGQFGVSWNAWTPANAFQDAYFYDGHG